MHIGGLKAGNAGKIILATAIAGLVGLGIAVPGAPLSLFVRHRCPA